MLSIFRVSGSSLLPDFQHGDFVLIAAGSHTIARVSPGDVIVFQQAGYGTLIKRVSQVHPDDVLVTGTGENSTDSRHFGPVPRRAIRGKVVWHIKRRR